MEPQKKKKLLLPTSGDIPPGNYDAASGFLYQTLYIFGGCQDDKEFTNALTTLSSTGHFKRLQPTGDVPSPRAFHRGFYYNGKIYFLGGVVESADPFRSCDFLPRNRGGYYTNELVCLDPDSNQFFRVSTTGSRPALVRLGKRVFVHGGFCNRSVNDFFVLDVETMIWTELQNARFPKGIRSHTLSRLPRDRILLVGGLLDDGDKETVSKV